MKGDSKWLNLQKFLKLSVELWLLMKASYCERQTTQIELIFIIKEKETWVNIFVLILINIMHHYFSIYVKFWLLQNQEMHSKEKHFLKSKQMVVGSSSKNSIIFSKKVFLILNSILNLREKMHFTSKMLQYC